MPSSRNPAELHPHSPAWADLASTRLADIRRALRGVPGADTAEFDHIGSTSVPGLRAKPFIDLQVRIFPLPPEGVLAERLSDVGLTRARGSRPDSPGVDRDIPRGDECVPEEVWDKRLFVSSDGSTILHIRRADSPWGRYTVWFRDWLRQNDAAREAYERTKARLSAENIGKSDYDDYTLAKTAFFDTVQDEFVAWAKGRA